MKLALVQIDIHAGNPAENFKKIREIYQLLASRVDLVVLPELSLSGYYVGDRWEQNSFLQECEDYGQELAKLTHDTALIFGNVGIDRTKTNEDGRVRKYNAAYCAQNGKFLKHPKLPYSFWIKSLSPNYRIFDESRYFFDLRKLAYELNTDVKNILTPISVPYKNKHLNIALNICEDIWDENYFLSPTRELCKHKVDLILNLSTSPFTLGKNSKRKRIFDELVKSVKTPLAYINAVGIQNLGKNIYTFDGSSAVHQVNKSCQQAPMFKESVLFYDTDSQNCDAMLFNETHSHLIPCLPTHEKSEIETIYEALTEALRLILNQWKIPEIVIGVSGGIDSALSAALYSKVLGSSHVHLVNMPSRFNSDLTINAAKQLAANLKCSYIEVPIQEFTDRTVKQLSAFQNVSDFVIENIQARDRSSRILAALAAMQNGVFPCNANKTELTVGYCTLYGDAGGFLAGLADLWKGQIYALARHINALEGSDVIPQTSLDIVPSAELSAKQDVKKGLGDPLIYPYHDALFRTWVEDWERKTPEDCLLAFENNSMEAHLNFSRKEILKFFNNDVNLFIKDLERWWFAYTGMGAFKRLQSPPILSISRRAFGCDHRESVGSIPLSSNYYRIKERLLK